MTTPETANENPKKPKKDAQMVNAEYYYPGWFGLVTILICILGIGVLLAKGVNMSSSAVNAMGAFLVAIGAIFEIFARFAEERHKMALAGGMHNFGLSLLAIGAVVIALAPWGGNS